MKKERFVKVDSHAHITSDELYPDVEGILKRAVEAKVSKIVNINTDRITWERAFALQKKYPDLVFNTVATTPHDVEKEGEENFAYFEKIIRAKQVVAVGEVGLDYYYAHSKKEIQKEFLHRYFNLANEVDLPVVIHCRGDDAFVDLFKYTQPVKAVLHCFTGNAMQAEIALERGWYISISGIATFKKSTELRNVIQTIPLERLFMETDAPYLSPQSKRGSTNEPSFIVEVAETIALVKQIPLEDVCYQTTQNVSDFLGIVCDREF